MIINYDWNLYETFWKSVLTYYAKANDSENTDDLRYFKIDNVLTNTIKSLIQNIETYGTDYLFFTVLEENINQNQSKNYIKSVIGTIAPYLFDTDSKNEYKISKYFIL